MTDFTGTYEFTGELPQQWSEQLRNLASTAGLDLRAASKVGSRLIITIRVPKTVPAPASEVAGAFLADVASVLSGSVDSGRAQLISTAVARSRARPILSFIGAILALSASGAVSLYGVISIVGFLESLGVSPAISVFLLAGISIIFVAAVMTFGGNVRQEFAATAERERQAVQESALAQQVAGEEDPKLRARIELARIALRIRASSMRSDADRLWKRSIWAYRGAFVFFLLAIAGPGVASLLLLNSAAPDWHFMFGGLSLAAVPLGIGTALLRHDTKLREQYHEAAQDVAALERYELALDYARIATPETYQATMQQVITQLLMPRSAFGNQVQPSATREARARELEKSGETDDVPGVQRIVSATVDAARDVVTSIAPKKGG
jgi:hypothetical protein